MKAFYSDPEFKRMLVEALDSAIKNTPVGRIRSLPIVSLLRTPTEKYVAGRHRTKLTGAEHQPWAWIGFNQAFFDLFTHIHETVGGDYSLRLLEAIPVGADLGAAMKSLCHNTVNKIADRVVEINVADSTLALLDVAIAVAYTTFESNLETLRGPSNEYLRKMLRANTTSDPAEKQLCTAWIKALTNAAYRNPKDAIECFMEAGYLTPKEYQEAWRIAAQALTDSIKLFTPKDEK